MIISESDNFLYIQYRFAFWERFGDIITLIIFIVGLRLLGYYDAYYNSRNPAPVCDTYDGMCPLFGDDRISEFFEYLSTSNLFVLFGFIVVTVLLGIRNACIKDYYKPKYVTSLNLNVIDNVIRGRFKKMTNVDGVENNEERIIGKLSELNYVYTEVTQANLWLLDSQTFIRRKDYNLIFLFNGFDAETIRLIDQKELDLTEEVIANFCQKKGLQVKFKLPTAESQNN
jgi:hypothetical protein